MHLWFAEQQQRMEKQRPSHIHVWEQHKGELSPCFSVYISVSTHVSLTETDSCLTFLWMVFLLREVILDKIWISSFKASKGIQPEDCLMQLALRVPLILSGHLCDEVKWYNPPMMLTRVPCQIILFSSKKFFLWALYCHFS